MRASKNFRDVLKPDHLFDEEDWQKTYNFSFADSGCDPPVFPHDVAMLNGPCPISKNLPARETHFGFLGLSMLDGKMLNLTNWHALHPAETHPRIGVTPQEKSWWLDGWAFALHRAPTFQWYLMFLGSMPDSTGLDFDRQCEGVNRYYAIPTAVEIAVAFTLFYRKNGRYPVNDLWLRSADAIYAGQRVVISADAEKGIIIGQCPDLARLPNVGLAVYRKPIIIAPWKIFK